MSFTMAMKNKYFTYFNAPGGTAKYREAVQVWNSQGLTISVQGPDWIGAYNGFAKRHLLSTEGGKHATTGGGGWQAKATNLQAKRAANPAQARQPKMNQMAAVLTASAQQEKETELGRQLLMKNAGDRDVIKGFQTSAISEVKDHYKTDPYGPQTPLVTVIVMDGMTGPDVANCFAQAILAQVNWVNNTPKSHIRVPFPATRVHTIQNSGTITDYPAVLVSICRGANQTYHVYHCDGGSI